MLEFKFKQWVIYLEKKCYSQSNDNSQLHFPTVGKTLIQEQQESLEKSQCNASWMFHLKIFNFLATND